MKLTRRKFLIGTGLVGGGLILGLQFKPKMPVPNTLAGSFQPNAWLQITEDGRVIFQLDKVEMGQGVMTSMAMTIGEELDYNPANIIVELAGIHPDFANTDMGAQLTGASTSTKTTFTPLREAGASARALLMKAAADKWHVDVSECTTDDGKVLHVPSKQSASYAELAHAAKSVGSVGAIALKQEADFRWIGTSMPRKDAPGKVDGSSIFGIDVQLPNMKVAVIKRCPHLGGKPLSYDAASIEKLAGVRKVFVMHSGIAIIADTYWQARKACDALHVEWDKGPLGNLDSATIEKRYIEALEQGEAKNGVNEGDTAEAIAQSTRVIKADYSTPYFHHSPMEPQNTTAMVHDGKCEVWSPSQAPDMARALISHYTGIKPEHITVHSQLMGGAFGRRGYVDFAGEAGAIAAAFPDVPVKLIWSREDDMQHDFYRGYSYHRMEAALDDASRITAWQHRLVAPSIVQTIMPTLMPVFMPSWIKSQSSINMATSFGNAVAAFDPGLFEGAKIPYHFPNIKVDAVHLDVGIPTGFWRSVGNFHNAFAVECFLDECAHAAGIDPAELRRKKLRKHPRHLRVLETVLAQANWGKSGKHQGLAVHASFESFVAMVVEVSVSDKAFTVDKVYCAVDCGLPINPDIIVQQMESGIVYGLTAAIKPSVTFKEGAVEQSNFHDLPVLRLSEMPKVEVMIIKNTEKPGGVGEIAVPPITPALGNALFAATGQRLRSLPFVLS